MSPGGGPRVKHSRSQRLDLEAAETLGTGRAENHAKGNCGGKKPRNSEDSTMHFIDKNCSALTGHVSLWLAESKCCGSES